MLVACIGILIYTCWSMKYNQYRGPYVKVLHYSRVVVKIPQVTLDTGRDNTYHAWIKMSKNNQTLVSKFPTKFKTTEMSGDSVFHVVSYRQQGCETSDPSCCLLFGIHNCETTENH